MHASNIVIDACDLKCMIMNFPTLTDKCEDTFLWIFLYSLWHLLSEKIVLYVCC